MREQNAVRGMVHQCIVVYDTLVHHTADGYRCEWANEHFPLPMHRTCTTRVDTLMNGPMNIFLCTILFHICIQKLMIKSTKLYF